jgi:hypothetical protein
MLIVRSAFVHQEYAGVDVFFLSHDLRFFYGVFSAAYIYDVAGRRFRLCTCQRCEGRIDAASIGIVAIGRYVILFGVQHYRQAEQKEQDF